MVLFERRQQAATTVSTRTHTHQLGVQRGLEGAAVGDVEVVRGRAVEVGQEAVDVTRDAVALLGHAVHSAYGLE